MVQQPIIEEPFPNQTDVILSENTHTDENEISQDCVTHLTQELVVR